MDKENKAVSFSDVYETCQICGKDMDDIDEIFIDVELDQYICKQCKNEYEIEAVKCRPLEYEEED